MTLLILFFLISIVFSFLCSIWEAALLSVTPSFVENELQKESTTGRILSSFKENIDRPLAAILTLNTIAHTVGAIGVGAQAGKLWGNESWKMLGYPLNAEAVIATVMTLAILILSEIIPKTIGASYWQPLAGFTARGIKAIMIGLWPLVWLAQLITRSMKKDKAQSVLSRRDISAMASIGVKSGTLSQNEFRLLQNVLTFRTVKSKDIMTPRTVLVSAPETMLVKEFHKSGLGDSFSRIPIFKENIDQVTGYVLKHEVYEMIIEGNGDQPLSAVGRPLLFIEEDDTIYHVLEIMIQNKEQIARVVGEYGGTSGIITLEDIIETLLGLEILDELDIAADLQEMARERWESTKK
ncbi:MAG: hemolysin family protein [Saprospiraceae bacterium]|nr:hemolysin family protein [Saprospiraceae bacterium]